MTPHVLIVKRVTLKKILIMVALIIGMILHVVLVVGLNGKPMKMNEGQK